MRITPKTTFLFVLALGLAGFSAAGADQETSEFQVKDSSHSDAYDAYVLDLVMPKYPEQYRRSGIEGRALLEVGVNEAGNIDRLSVVAASRPSFGNAAKDAVRQWLFAPGRRNGVSVSQIVLVPVDFRLEAPVSLNGLLPRN